MKKSRLISRVVRQRSRVTARVYKGVTSAGDHLWLYFIPGTTPAEGQRIFEEKYNYSPKEIRTVVGGFLAVGPITHRLV